MSCGREPTASSIRVRSLGPVLLRFPGAFEQAGLPTGIVPIDRVRIVVRNPRDLAVIDSVTPFAGADSLNLPLRIPLDIWFPDEREPFALSLAFVSPQGDTLFRGGPVELRVADGNNAGTGPVLVPVAYTGLGSDATGLRISPRSLVVVSGQDFTFTAQALGANGGAIPGTPVAWTTLDPAQAGISAPTDGAGVAVGVTGTARIVGQLLTGPADTVTLVIQPRAPTLQLTSGAGQSAAASTALAGPVVVRVAEGNGAGRAGVQVSFAPANGGSAAPATATTDATGAARTMWTLGSSVGTQQLKVVAAGATGSPLTVNATATNPDTTQPAHHDSTTTAHDSTAQAQHAATRLAFTAQPAGAVAGVAMAAVAVTAMNDSGHVVTDFTNPITVALADANGAGLSGDRTVSAVGGTATFANLELSQVASGLRLIATSGPLQPDTSAAFSVGAGPAARIAVDGGDAQSAAISTALATPLTAKVTDAFGNPVGLVTVSFAVASGGGAVSVASVQTSAAGLASTTWTLGPTAGTQAVTGTADGLAGSPVRWTATATAEQATSHLAFVQEPTNSIAGHKMTPSVVVQALRPDGTHDPLFAGTVTLTLASNPGGATLSGATADIGAGSAVFNDLSLDHAGTGYQIVASAPGAESATSGLFDVNAAQATAFQLVGGDGQEAVVSTALASPLAVRVVDDLGNPVANVTVAWAVESGNGALSAPSSVTDATGVAVIVWTLGPLPGKQTVIASVSGLAGSPITFSAQAKQKKP